jgi:hypothetical protein
VGNITGSGSGTSVTGVVVVASVVVSGALVVVSGALVVVSGALVVVSGALVVVSGADVSAIELSSLSDFVSELVSFLSSVMDDTEESVCDRISELVSEDEQAERSIAAHIMSAIILFFIGRTLSF